MIHIPLHGRDIPALGYGTWQLKGKDCETGVARALDIGYRHIDTAQIYENEAEVGAALAGAKVDRKDIFLTTKVWLTSLRDGDMQRSVEESLRKLRTDYVDLLLIHWPVTEQASFAEQMKSLRSLHDGGKARMIGVSNFTVAQMKEVAEDLGAPISNNQVEYHPFLSQKPVLDFVRAHEMFLTAYSPLARGKVGDNATLREMAERHGKTPGQVSLRWLLQQPRVAAIPKASGEKHMRENFDIFDFELSAGEMETLHRLARPDGRLISPDWAPRWDRAEAA